MLIFQYSNTNSIKDLTNQNASIKLYVNDCALADDTIHFVEGMPQHSIPEKVTELNAEIAVIGNNEDTNYIDKIFGDTAVELAHVMLGDLLVVKPDAS